MNCLVCGEHNESISTHDFSELHRFNVVLYEFKKYRKAIAKDRNGVEVKISTKNSLPSGPLKIQTESKEGEYICSLTQSEMQQQLFGITYDFKIIAKTPIHFMDCRILRSDINSFTYKDVDNKFENDGIPSLEANATYNVALNLKENSIGEFRMPIAFTFQTIDNKTIFNIVKEMVVVVKSNYSLLNTNSNLQSPFTNNQWTNEYVIIDTILPSYSINYCIPLQFENVLQYCLQKFDGITVEETKTSKKIQKILNSQLTIKIYKDFFRYLLWLDEVGARIKLQHYNMENVILNTREPNIVVLNVPGLGEKRPSVIRGDYVLIRFHEATVVYKGKVKNVNEADIWIEGFSSEFFDQVSHFPGSRFDVQFDINRLLYERMHKALDLLTETQMEYLLFPEINQNLTINNRNIFYLNDSNLKDNNIKNNEKQKQVIVNILNRTSKNAPYIIFGPPGTGKTITVVEAIFQIIKNIPSSTILACAPTNSTCDMITLKLSAYFTKDELIRVHSETVDWSSVPDAVKNYSTRDKKKSKVNGARLQKYKIIVATLGSIGKFASHLKATHVFIDEAAQVTEPETLLAISGILVNNGQFILAGDPKQLGPICNSTGAEGLKTSLLSRLMEMQLYSNLNPNFITKLLLNYRNHPNILLLSNELFYNNELQPVSKYPINDSISKVILPVGSVAKKSFVPQAIEFYNANGTERKEGRSPSYFNEMEIGIVLKYLEALTNPKAEVVIKPEEIGVVVPYIRQKYKIQNNLPEHLKKIEVGTTESFQGREKRVVIISTVRAQASLLLYDKKYNIGFVNNPERFNVAVTRAISKLIVVGNAQCLYTNKNWEFLINYCKTLGSYRGFNITKRDAIQRKQMTKNVGMLKFKPEDQKQQNRKKK